MTSLTMLTSIVAPPQGVWASMYNERAMLSMKKVGIDFRDIRMAVLCQRVVQVRRRRSVHNMQRELGQRAVPWVLLFLRMQAAVVDKFTVKLRVSAGRGHAECRP